MYFNFFYVTRDSTDFWGGCLAAIPAIPLNYSSVVGYEGYFHALEGKTNIQYSLKVSILS